MQTALVVNANADKQTIETVSDTIIRILEAKADQKTIRLALETLSRSTSVRTFNVQNCTLGDRTTHVHGPQPSDETEEDTYTQE